MREIKKQFSARKTTEKPFKFTSSKQQNIPSLFLQTLFDSSDTIMQSSETQGQL